MINLRILSEQGIKQNRVLRNFKNIFRDSRITRRLLDWI